MNYNSVILVGVVAITAIWWFVHASRHYPGPKVMSLYVYEATGVHDPDVLAAGIGPKIEKRG